MFYPVPVTTKSESYVPHAKTLAFSPPDAQGCVLFKKTQGSNMPECIHAAHGHTVTDKHMHIDKYNDPIHPYHLNTIHPQHIKVFYFTKQPSEMSFYS